MADDWTENPFASQSDPFRDPSVTAATTAVPEYNPFAAAPIPAAAAPAAAPVAAPAAAPRAVPARGPDVPSWANPTPQPAAQAPAPVAVPRAAPAPVQQVQAMPPPQQQQQHIMSPAEIARQQEYERREREMAQAADPGARVANFPPIPMFMRCGIFKPCYYVNIKQEIPVYGRTVVRIALYTWELLAFTLFWNFICTMAALAGDASGKSVSCALSALYFLLFTPCSYHCWFHPLYGAMRKDSSMRFGWFFLVMTFQFLCCIFFVLGVEGTGAAGIIVSAKTIDKSKGAGALMFTCVILWIAHCLIDIYLLQAVLKIYRTTGGSVGQAQREAVQAAASNQAVQRAAINAATDQYASYGKA